METFLCSLIDDYFKVRTTKSFKAKNANNLLKLWMKMIVTNKKIMHTMINVTNMDRSIEFYVNKVGLKLLRPPREMPDPRDPQRNMWIAFLTDENGGFVELGCPAYEHICLGVEDVEKTVEEFKSKGIEVAKEPFTMPTGRKSPIWFKDPDGMWVEIVKRS